MDTLVLNADGQPISVIPPSVVNWKEAVTYLFLDKVSVLEWYDDWIVSSASWETRVPAIIMLKDMIKRKRTPRFSRYNLFLRDRFKCQYCSTRQSHKVLTLDHVTPVSKGGNTSWENLVAACAKCNQKRGNNDNIRPIREPYVPTYFELANIRKEMDFDVPHPSWREFLN